MENASKALIIAGAILISIVLIAIGVLVVNNLREPVDEAVAGMSSQAKQIFNAKFEQYVGTNRSSADVKSLISALRSNATSTDSVAKIPEITPTSITGAAVIATPTDITNITTYTGGLNTLNSKIVASNNYIIEMEYSSAGLINKVKITKI